MGNGLFPKPDVIEHIKGFLGPKGWLDAADDTSSYLSEWRGLYRGRAALIAFPKSVEEVARIVRVCADNEIPIVPQGGNTGLCGGAVPGDRGDEILLSLKRLNAIREIDAANYTLSAEAGCILADVQKAARAVDRLFPLSLGAEGSCSIGGNISTNAGGINVLRYGNTRDLVLGLEVVLPDGRIWNGLRRLRKDNTGYDMKQLFIGAEGTLGVITAAVLKLFPLPKTKATALLAVKDVQAAIDLFLLARELSEDNLTAFEIIPDIAVDFIAKHQDFTHPLGRSFPWLVLIELTSADAGGRAASDLEAIWTAAEKAGHVLDGAVAENVKQQESLWRLRELIPEVQRLEGASIKHDVSVPVSAIPEFIAKAAQEIAKAMPDARVVAFGHIGDGNVHFNVSQPVGMDPDEFLRNWAGFNRLVHDIVESLGGSFSAEHGIGQLKRRELRRYKSGLELELMHAVKRALDPKDIMNRGKLLPAGEASDERL